MSPRQPKLHATLRIWAVGCALLWLVGPVMCGMERVSNSLDRDDACGGHASHTHDVVAEHEHDGSHGAAHLHDAAEAHDDGAISHHHDDGQAPHQQHDSKNKKSCDDKRCCSTMQAFLQTTKPIAIAKPVSQPVAVIYLLCAAHERALAASKAPPDRQAESREWVFTPEVSLGPAFRSHAPPVFI